MTVGERDEHAGAPFESRRGAGRKDQDNVQDSGTNNNGRQNDQYDYYLGYSAPEGKKD